MLKIWPYPFRLRGQNRMLSMIDPNSSNYNQYNNSDIQTQRPSYHGKSWRAGFKQSDIERVGSSKFGKTSVNIRKSISGQNSAQNQPREISEINKDLAEIEEQKKDLQCVKALVNGDYNQIASSALATQFRGAQGARIVSRMVNGQKVDSLKFDDLKISLSIINVGNGLEMRVDYYGDVSTAEGARMADRNLEAALGRIGVERPCSAMMLKIGNQDVYVGLPKENVFSGGKRFAVNGEGKDAKVLLSGNNMEFLSRFSDVLDKNFSISKKNQDYQNVFSPQKNQEPDTIENAAFSIQQLDGLAKSMSDCRRKFIQDEITNTTKYYADKGDKDNKFSSISKEGSKISKDSGAYRALIRLRTATDILAGIKVAEERDSDVLRQGTKNQQVLDGMKDVSQQVNSLWQTLNNSYISNEDSSYNEALAFSLMHNLSKSFRDTYHESLAQDADTQLMYDEVIDAQAAILSQFSECIDDGDNKLSVGLNDDGYIGWSRSNQETNFDENNWQNSLTRTCLFTGREKSKSDQSIYKTLRGTDSDIQWERDLTMDDCINFSQKNRGKYDQYWNEKENKKFLDQFWSDENADHNDIASLADDMYDTYLDGHVSFAVDQSDDQDLKKTLRNPNTLQDSLTATISSKSDIFSKNFQEAATNKRTVAAIAAINVTMEIAGGDQQGNHAVDRKKLYDELYEFYLSEFSAQEPEEDNGDMEGGVSVVGNAVQLFPDNDSINRLRALQDFSAVQMLEQYKRKFAEIEYLKHAGARKEIGEPFAKLEKYNTSLDDDKAATIDRLLEQLKQQLGINGQPNSVQLDHDNEEEIQKNFEQIEAYKKELEEVLEICDRLDAFRESIFPIEFRREGVNQAKTDAAISQGGDSRIVMYRVEEEPGHYQYREVKLIRSPIDNIDKKLSDARRFFRSNGKVNEYKEKIHPQNLDKLLAEISVLNFAKSEDTALREKCEILRDIFERTSRKMINNNFSDSEDVVAMSGDFFTHFSDDNVDAVAWGVIGPLKSEDSSNAVYYVRENWADILQAKVEFAEQAMQDIPEAVKIYDELVQSINAAKQIIIKPAKTVSSNKKSQNNVTQAQDALLEKNDTKNHEAVIQYAGKNGKNFECLDSEASKKLYDDLTQIWNTTQSPKGYTWEDYQKKRQEIDSFAASGNEQVQKLMNEMNSAAKLINNVSKEMGSSQYGGKLESRPSWQRHFSEDEIFKGFYQASRKDGKAQDMVFLDKSEEESINKKIEQIKKGWESIDKAVSLCDELVELKKTVFPVNCMTIRGGNVAEKFLEGTIGPVENTSDFIASSNRPKKSITFLNQDESQKLFDNLKEVRKFFEPNQAANTYASKINKLQDLGVSLKNSDNVDVITGKLGLNDQERSVFTEKIKNLRTRIANIPDFSGDYKDSPLCKEFCPEQFEGFYGVQYKTADNRPTKVFLEKDQKQSIEQKIARAQEVRENVQNADKICDELLAIIEQAQERLESLKHVKVRPMGNSDVNEAIVESEDQNGISLKYTNSTDMIQCLNSDDSQDFFNQLNELRKFFTIGNKWQEYSDKFKKVEHLKHLTKWTNYDLGKSEIEEAMRPLLNLQAGELKDGESKFNEIKNSSEAEFFKSFHEVTNTASDDEEKKVVLFSSAEKDVQNKINELKKFKENIEKAINICGELEKFAKDIVPVGKYKFYGFDADEASKSFTGDYALEKLEDSEGKFRQWHEGYSWDYWSPEKSVERLNQLNEARKTVRETTFLSNFKKKIDQIKAAGISLQSERATFNFASSESGKEGKIITQRLNLSEQETQDFLLKIESLGKAVEHACYRIISDISYCYCYDPNIEHIEKFFKRDEKIFYGYFSYMFEESSQVDSSNGNLYYLLDRNSINDQNMINWVTQSIPDAEKKCDALLAIIESATAKQIKSEISNGVQTVEGIDDNEVGQSGNFEANSSAKGTDSLYTTTTLFSKVTVENDKDTNNAGGVLLKYYGKNDPAPLEHKCLSLEESSKRVDEINNIAYFLNSVGGKRDLDEKLARVRDFESKKKDELNDDALNQLFSDLKSKIDNVGIENLRNEWPIGDGIAGRYLNGFNTVRNLKGGQDAYLDVSAKQYIDDRINAGKKGIEGVREILAICKKIDDHAWKIHKIDLSKFSV